jgi:hypothetical protein
VLGTQETSCILIAGLLERDIFDLFLPEFDKPWVIHLRETCCCSTNLCTWRPNTVYKNRSVRRHHITGEEWCDGGVEELGSAKNGKIVSSKTTSREINTRSEGTWRHL